MESASMEIEGRPTTGEDIGKITWPQVPAESGHVPDEFEGHGPIHNQLLERAGAFRGSYDFSRRGLTGILRATDVEGGMIALELDLHFPANTARGEQRCMKLMATVRESWAVEAARGANTRNEQGERIAGALAGLAMIPGQKTVSCTEKGVSIADAVSAVTAALGAGLAV